MQAGAAAVIFATHFEALRAEAGAASAQRRRARRRAVLEVIGLALLLAAIAS